MQRTIDLVHRSQAAETVDPFEERVVEQAEYLREAIEAGEMDNEDFAVGLEMEVYAVAAEDHGRLTPIPEAVFESEAANKELGLHNVEVNTEPNTFDGNGLAAQADAIEERTRRAKAAAREQGCELVLDAMWTIPPEEGSQAYLSEIEEQGGVTVAANMRPDPRYIAIDNHALANAGGELTLDVPGATQAFPTILFESLATSIQPHLQVPSAAEFPEYYNVAIRTMGPVLALATNSPFLPGDLYDEVEDPEAVVDETHHELRIAAFEQSVNTTPRDKVRVPRDIESASEVADRVVADDRYAPFLREWLAEGERERLAERIWEFDYKRSTYWRWLRCVIGGDPVDGAGDERSLRIEYRPLPTQPTVSDVVGLQALVAGLVRGLVEADHPLAELSWGAAENSFYEAVEHGLEADLAWLTADGDRTADADVIFEEVFEYARTGLDAAGVPDADVEQYLAPIEARWDAGVTPSTWKKARVRERLATGESFPAAITSMQRTYIRRSRETDSFAEWL